MISPAEIADLRARNPIGHYVAEIGVTLHRRAGRLVGPCVLCGGGKHTVRFEILRPGAAGEAWVCAACGKGGDVIKLVQLVHGIDFRAAVERLGGPRVVSATEANAISARTAAAQTTRDSEAERDREAARERCREIWRGAIPIVGTPGETYLRDVRRIDTAAIFDVLERGDAIRWHSAVYLHDPGHDLHGRRLGCVIGRMTDAQTNGPTSSISRTYISPDGRKVGKAKTLGSPAGIVRPSRDDDVCQGLFIAEGVETALAAMSIGLRPIWSTGSTALMRALPPLGGVECINIVADHDESGGGQRAAAECAALWRAAGREARVLMLDRLGDFNDALRGDRWKAPSRR